MLSVSPELLVDTSANISEETPMVSLHGVILFVRLPIHVRPSALSSVDDRVPLNCNRQCNLPTCVPDFAITSLTKCTMPDP